MRKKNIDLYKNVKKNLEHFIEAHSYEIDKPKEEAKQDIRNFIEKMAIWFELRYPDCEIKKIFGSTNIETDITTKIFYNNPNLADILKNSMTEIDLKWHNFYNYDAFYASLSEEEKRFIKEPCYPRILYLYSGRIDHVHLSFEGIVERYEYTFPSSFINNVIDECDECNNWHIEKFVEILEKNGEPIDRNSETYKAINSYHNQNRLRNNIIECVMYRIMMRGNNKISYRRAFLFAKEFNRDMQLLLNYGLENDDYNLLLSISEYFKTMGIEDTVDEKVFQKHLKLTNLY